MRIRDLENKNIGIWGLGVEGKAVLKTLNEIYPNKKIIVIDDKKLSSEEILSELTKLDVVIRSPGVSIYKPEIIEAKKNGLIVLTEKTLFFNEINNTSGLDEDERPKIIAISGTKGKTTTSIFCAYLLQKMGYKVLLAGNMGISTIELLDEAKQSDFVVVELSSYQNSDLMANIDVAIILNLFPEHIDWHKTHENYYNDKLNLIKNANYRIINGSDERILSHIDKNEAVIKFGTVDTINYHDGFFYDGNKKLLSSQNMELLGEHNYQNLCSILTAMKVLGLDFSKIEQDYFDKFKPVEHRLETITHNVDNKKVLFVNDSISTIPEAAIACYKIFKEKNIYGILGGFDRNQDYEELINYIVNNKNIKFLTLLGQTGKRLYESFMSKNFKNVKMCNDLAECVNVLKKQIIHDDLVSSVVLLSPASPSYDMFKNFEERGKLFKELIK